MKLIMEQFGSSIIYAIAGSGMAAILISFLRAISRKEKKMKEIVEEYGEFVIEAISGVILLGIIAILFFGTPMTALIQKFIMSVLGGGM